MSDYENVNTTPDYENVKTIDLRGWVAQRAADQVANDSSFKESWVVEHLAWFDGVIAMIQAEAWDEACDHLEIECDHNPYREVSK